MRTGRNPTPLRFRGDKEIILKSGQAVKTLFVID